MDPTLSRDTKPGVKGASDSDTSNSGSPGVQSHDNKVGYPRGVGHYVGTLLSGSKSPTGSLWCQFIPDWLTQGSQLGMTPCLESVLVGLETTYDEASRGNF